MRQSDSQTELLSVVAHDLKTPISAVMGYLDLLQQAGTLNERQQHFVDRAMAGLNYMQHLAVDLVDIAWIDAGAPLDISDCNLRSIVRDTVTLMETLASKRQIKIHVNVQPNLGRVKGDARRLSQVMNNLLSNAIKYNREDGHIWVSATNDTDVVQVNIRDTGIGIPPEDHRQVFERFFRSRAGLQLKVDGSGLGLAIVDAIIQKHGGRIWLESVPGEGSTFSFTLPRKALANVRYDPETETTPRFYEGNEGGQAFLVELASEEMDSVDDNMQESPDEAEMDSHSDEL